MLFDAPWGVSNLFVLRKPDAPHHRPGDLHSDSAVKQILVTLNEKDSFIIEDLDDFHVVIKADEEYRVRRQLEDEVRAHMG